MEKNRGSVRKQRASGGAWARVAAVEVGRVVRFWADFESRADRLC